MLQELPVQQRTDAVSSLVYEAYARVKDPVYGCVGAISYLQNQVSELQMQLAVAQAEILYIQMQHHDDDEPVTQIPEMGMVLDHNFPSSSNVIHHDSLSRESVFGYDVVSWMKIVHMLFDFFNDLDDIGINAVLESTMARDYVLMK